MLLAFESGFRVVSGLRALKSEMHLVVGDFPRGGGVYKFCGKLYKCFRACVLAGSPCALADFIKSVLRP